MFYTWSLSHNTAVPIDTNNKKYFLSFDTETTEIAWGYDNSNKNWTQKLDSLIPQN